MSGIALGVGYGLSERVALGILGVRVTKIAAVKCVNRADDYVLMVWQTESTHIKPLVRSEWLEMSTRKPREELNPWMRFHRLVESVVIVSQTTENDLGLRCALRQGQYVDRLIPNDSGQESHRVRFQTPEIPKEYVQSVAVQMVVRSV